MCWNSWFFLVNTITAPWSEASPDRFRKRHSEVSTSLTAEMSEGRNTKFKTPSSYCPQDLFTSLSTPNGTRSTLSSQRGSYGSCLIHQDTWMKILSTFQSLAHQELKIYELFSTILTPQSFTSASSNPTLIFFSTPISSTPPPQLSNTLHSAPWCV